MMTVSQITRLLGINRETVYFYERSGLIPPPQRSGSGYRLFSEEDINRLFFIINGKELGLSLNEIRGILTLEDESGLDNCKAHQLFIDKINFISLQIEKLNGIREKLVLLSKGCSECRKFCKSDNERCPIKTLLNT